MSDPNYENVGDIETRAIEECSELIQILCKVQRFGINNWHPDDELKTPNYVLVQQEIADVKKVIMKLEHAYELVAYGRDGKWRSSHE